MPRTGGLQQGSGGQEGPLPGGTHPRLVGQSAASLSSTSPPLGLPHPSSGWVWAGRTVGRQDAQYGVPSTAEHQGEDRGKWEQLSFLAQCPPGELFL